MFPPPKSPPPKIPIRPLVNYLRLRFRWLQIPTSCVLNKESCWRSNPKSPGLLCWFSYTLEEPSSQRVQVPSPVGKWICISIKLISSRKHEVLSNSWYTRCVMITYNIYIVIRKQVNLAQRESINDFIGNVEQTHCFTAIHWTSRITNSALDIKIPKYSENTIK